MIPRPPDNEPIAPESSAWLSDRAKRSLLADAVRPRHAIAPRQHAVRFHAPKDTDVPSELQDSVAAELFEFKKQHQERREQERRNAELARALEQQMRIVVESTSDSAPTGFGGRRNKGIGADSSSGEGDSRRPSASAALSGANDAGIILPILVTQGDERADSRLSVHPQGHRGVKHNVSRSLSSTVIGVDLAATLLGINMGDEGLGSSMTLNANSFHVPSLSGTVRTDESGRVVTAFEQRRTANKQPVARSAAATLGRRRKGQPRSTHYPVPHAPAGVSTPRRDVQQSARLPRTAVDEFAAKIGLRSVTDFSDLYSDRVVQERLAEAAAAQRHKQLILQQQQSPFRGRRSSSNNMAQRAAAASDSRSSSPRTPMIDSPLSKPTSLTSVGGSGTSSMPQLQIG